MLLALLVMESSRLPEEEQWIMLYVSPRLFQSPLLSCTMTTMIWTKEKLGLCPTNNTTAVNILMCALIC